MFSFLSRLFGSKPAKPSLTPERRAALRALMEQIARPGVDLKLLPDAPPVPLGGSKIGGCPDLPPDFVWPTYRDPEDGETRPLSFMAQVKLADAAPCDPRHELPPGGMLYFFVDMVAERWGFDPADAGSARVIYVEDATQLTRGSYPAELGEEQRYDERAVRLEPALIPPDYANTDEKTEAAIIDIGGGDDDAAIDMYCDLKQEYRGYGKYENGSYLLGYPDIQQDVMEEECELITRGHSMGRGRPDMGTDAREEVARAAKDWQLLFQLASITDEDGKSELMFGDLGNLYFWIRRQDLAARRFDRVWMMLQCG